jgi:hypothetical protein
MLLCALAVGVLSMHHLPATGSHSHTSHGQPTASAHPEPAPPQQETGCCQTDHLIAAPSLHCPGCVHSMLHLCLGVLMAIGTLIALRLLRGGRSARFSLLNLYSATPSVGRDPPAPPRVPELLSSLCVLRL